MDEAGKRLLAAPEDLRIARLDPLLGLGVDLAVVQRGAPVRRALEHGQVSHTAGNGLNGLHAGGAGPDHRYPLAAEVDRLMRPSGGVEGLALKAVQPLD